MYTKVSWHHRARCTWWILRACVSNYMCCCCWSRLSCWWMVVVLLAPWQGLLVVLVIVCGRGPAVITIVFLIYSLRPTPSNADRCAARSRRLRCGRPRRPLQHSAATGACGVARRGRASRNWSVRSQCGAWTNVTKCAESSCHRIKFFAEKRQPRTTQLPTPEARATSSRCGGKD